MPDTRVAIEMEIVQTVGQLSPENRLKVIRLMTCLAAKDGFTEAYKAFIDDAGGLENVDPDGIDKFIDEWEVSYKNGKDA